MHPSCAAGKSGFCTHVLALMLKICKYTLYNMSQMKTVRHHAPQPGRDAINPRSTHYGSFCFQNANRG